MAKQKIVVKVTMNESKKARKAMKIAVSVSGVESAAFVGPEKEQIAVTGEGIDSVELTTLLRKGVGRTELVSVGPVDDKTPAAKPAAGGNEATVQYIPVYPPYYNGYGGQLHLYQPPSNNYPSSSCHMM